MNPYYTDYSEYLSRFFGTRKVQKLSVNTGAGCPNRDGTISTGGCIYCNNASFTPSYCFAGGGVREQVEAGIRFFSRKYKEMSWLPYFQSYTSTHRTDATTLHHMLTEALDCEDVVGLVTATRPDSLAAEMVGVLAELNRRAPVFVELGVETMHDDTLRLINRGHDSSTTRAAIRSLADAGLHTGVHLIAGLPGEDESRILSSIDEICRLPVESIKLHHLQVLRGTPLAVMIEQGRIDVMHFTPESYADLCVEVVKRVPRRIAIERFLASAPPNMVISPKWGLKNYQFTNLLLNRLEAEMDNTDQPT